MLTFFRRIRKGLLDGGATRKYLVYAIGEIALVVIGILIALQINNWNEWRKDRNAEHIMIQTLKKELVLNREQFKRRVLRRFENEKSSVYLLKLTKPNPNHISPDSFSYHLTEALFLTYPNPRRGVIDRIINGDEFNLIQFDSLKILLNEYHASLNNIKVLEERTIEYGNDVSQLTYQKISLLNRVKRIAGRSDFYEKEVFDQLEGSKFVDKPELVLSSNYFEDLMSRYLMLSSVTHRVTDQIIEDMNFLIYFIEKHYSI